ncbi:hypothetical protein O181_036400 [Austropuccinia psidii MF-1]|uniref:Uncharacterized protein n=1 Tax=Austropuccinia psidii MF-1 TaxID=1389203 RepID=A0A9Q3D8W8_9BASI|nr:hypothetical protein [Austropuccinia psidii MF-1]
MSLLSSFLPALLLFNLIRAIPLENIVFSNQIRRGIRSGSQPSSPHHDHELLYCVESPDATLRLGPPSSHTPSFHNLPPQYNSLHQLDPSGPNTELSLGNIPSSSQSHSKGSEPPSLPFENRSAFNHFHRSCFVPYQRSSKKSLDRWNWVLPLTNQAAPVHGKNCNNELSSQPFWVTSLEAREGILKDNSALELDLSDYLFSASKKQGEEITATISPEDDRGKKQNSGEPSCVLQSRNQAQMHVPELAQAADHQELLAWSSTSEDGKTTAPGELNEARENVQSFVRPRGWPSGGRQAYPKVLVSVSEYGHGIATPHSSKNSRKTAIGQMEPHKKSANKPLSVQPKRMKTARDRAGTAKTKSVSAPDQTDTSVRLSNDRGKKVVEQVDSDEETSSSEDNLKEKGNECLEERRRRAVVSLYKVAAEREAQSLGEVHIANFLASMHVMLESQNKDFKVVRRISNFIKTSLVQIGLHAQLYKKIGTTGRRTLKSVRQEGFDFLKYFWKLLLTNEGDPHSPFNGIERKVDISKLLQTAKERLQNKKNGSKPEAPAWAATIAFVRVHWDDHKWTRRQQLIINNNVLLLGFECNMNVAPLIEGRALRPENLVSKRRSVNLFRNAQRSSVLYFEHLWEKAVSNGYCLSLRDFLNEISGSSRKRVSPLTKLCPEIIEKRIAYVVVASFVHIQLYVFFKKREQFSAANSSLKNKVFDILKQFWRLVLFKKWVKHHYPEFGDINVKPHVLKARKQLANPGGHLSASNVACWHGTEICLQFFWNQILGKAEKVFMNRKMTLLAGKGIQDIAGGKFHPENNMGSEEKLLLSSLFSS